jgi:ornithine--oxo-acid transaminase
MFRRVIRKFSLEKTISLEKTYGCWNYDPLPVVLEKGSGVHVWDTEGNKYFDCLSAYGAVNQGHVHPKIRQALIEQMDKITLTSRAFFNDQLGQTCKYIGEVFGYPRVIFANSGVEAGETAVKFARKWGYVKKGVPHNQAEVLFASENFWGRSLAACGSSDDPSRYENFGPFNMGFTIIPYGDIEAIEKNFKENPNIVAYMLEPIQGEAGIIIPPQNYLKQVRALCDKYNVLMIIDEIQTGIGRTGKLLCIDWDEIKADLVCLGKALSGGFFPVSAVLGSNEVFDCIKAGDHGSTYGGNPLACAVSRKSLDVLFEENMIENSRERGEELLKYFNEILQGKDYIKGTIN